MSQTLAGFKRKKENRRKKIKERKEKEKRTKSRKYYAPTFLFVVNTRKK